MDQDHTQDRSRDWRELCKEAATELDPAKLMNLIAELTRALNERDRNRQPAAPETDNQMTGMQISLHRKPAV